MTEEIYIDGIRMDLDDTKTNVQMIFQSPVLTDFQSIVSNRTTNVTLPLTQNNLRAIGYVGTQATSVFPYRKHSVIYKRDGVKLLSGFAVLLSIKASTISFCFTWGNTKAMETLFNTNLRELEGLGYSKYPAGIASVTSLPLINYGGERGGVGIRLENVLSAIQTKCGVTGLTNLDKVNSSGDMRYWFALTTRNGDLVTKEAQRFQSNSSLIAGEVYGFSQYRPWALMIGPGTNAKDFHNYYDAEDRVFRIEGSKKIRLKMKGTIDVTYDFYDQAGASSNLELIKMTGLDANNYVHNSNNVVICQPEIISYQPGQYYNLRYTFDYNGVIDVEGYTYIGLRLIAFGNMDGQSAGITSQSITTFEITCDEDEPEDVIYNTNLSAYPIAANLPDMTCGQFIKNLLWLRGEFAYSQDGKTFQIIGFNQLDANKAQAVDWTDKMVTLKPSERQTKLDTGQRNYFRYAETEFYDTTKFEGMLPTDDKTIELEKEYCKSDFAICPNNRIPVWSQDEDGAWEFNGDNIPAVLIVQYTLLYILTFRGYNSTQKWSARLSEWYNEYAKLIYRPVVLNAEFKLTTFDLFKLDMTIPVYLKQTGHYYLIRKLTTKSGGTADAELIQM